jgi:hypothetical protein
MSLSYSAGTALSHGMASNVAENRSGSRRTAVVATVATLVACLAIAVLMSASIALARPLPATGDGPLAQPIPQPTAAAGNAR